MPMIPQQALATALQYHQQGLWQLAEGMYRQILQQQPDHPEALHLLGTLAQQTGRSDLAIDLIRRAIALSPGAAHYYSNLGNILRIAGRTAEAIACFERALALEPDCADNHRDLGIALQMERRYAQASACYQQALQRNPNCAESWNLLGLASHWQDLPDQAEACYRKAIALRPNFVEACCHLAHLQSKCQRVDEAIESYRKAVAVNPRFAEAHRNLGNLLLEQGRIDEAVASCRTAVNLQLDSSSIHQTLLFSLLFDPGADLLELLAEHRRWTQRHAEPLASRLQPHGNDRSPERRLRVGYVSPDLRAHAVGWLIQALLAHHDHGSFEIVCYSSASCPDAVTQRLRGHSDLWRETLALGDQQLADLIRQDRIDILVDLSLHTAENRLLVFARKPAPVQVTYLGYPGSTGLRTIDYRLTNHHLTPPGSEGREGPEKLAFLPDCYYCYTAPEAAPPVNELPALVNGHITFGSPYSMAKVNDRVLALWAQILLAVPRSTLLMLVHGGERNRRIREVFQHHGIEPQRIHLLGKQPTSEQYFRIFHDMDLVLDTFPYSGHTMTMDAVYMGVPVVTLAGDRAVGRAGVSILENLGIPELIARTPEHYLRLATDLAADLPRLTELRRTLRDRMRRSPIMDGPRFARAVEAAYRQMWRTWCASTA